MTAPTLPRTKNSRIGLIATLVGLHLVSSRNDAWALISLGAVRVDGDIAQSAGEMVGTGVVLAVGIGSNSREAIVRFTPRFPATSSRAS
ncbi:S4 domain-containing protein [Acetobacter aceti]|nr:S4 domain-containing protein [Acetobacter aceti]